MPKFVKVAYTDELRPGECKAIRAEETTIALYNVDGIFYATDNACFHKGGPLGDGKLKGSLIVCPWHFWEFDVTTGRCAVQAGKHIRTYEVRIVKDEISVNLNNDAHRSY